MSVTEYKPKLALGCRYSYDKLENVVYLVSKSHTKNVFIDNGEAYINGLTTVPMKLEGFNINFTEESSLDERYKFTKQVTFSIHGYVPHTAFEGKYYVILKSKDGTKWMVNVDFPSKVTYDFHLDGQQYQTDFTFSSVSNFPTLRLASELDEGEDVCQQFKTFGIEYLKLLETDYCKLDTVNSTVYTYGKEFVDVEFLGQTCSLEEQFDGENVTTTIQFNIAFDAYKSSWHYNLLEFLQNHYSAVIKPKGNDHFFFSGFNFGLEPSFNVSTTSQNAQSDIITVTLTETSSYGSKNTTDWDEQGDEETRWVYIRQVGNIQGWECVGLNQARYLLQQEVYKNGQPTGRYKAYQGHSFPTLNIVGYFSTDYRFVETSCSQEICSINTNIPYSITYRSATCNTYTLSASCDWNVSGLASYLTVTPSNGVANTQYTVTVCNTKTPTDNESSTFNISTPNNVITVNVVLTTESQVINPTSTTITCLDQNVRFNFTPSCPITVTSIPTGLSYNITNSQLIVSVPRNYSTESAITWSIDVKDCQNRTQTVTIIQDKEYQRWVSTSDYICDGTTSYVKQQRYTGTTSSNINTPTSVYQKGDKIQDNDPRCGSYETKWEESSNFYCIDGDKWSFEEEYKRPQGGTWQKTGNTRLKTMVEADSSFCEETVQYKWELTDRWQCYGGVIPSEVKFRAEYSDSTTYSAECDATSAVTTSDTRAHSTSYTAMTNAEIGNCVTSIGQAAFSGCTSLTSIDIPSGVTNIGDYAFYYCTSLTSVVIPSGITSTSTYVFRNCPSLTSVTFAQGSQLTSIGSYSFGSCSGLTSITIPNSVTSIGQYAFTHCTGLTSIDIPSGVTSIGGSAFNSCYSLTNVVIPDSVTSIGQDAFGFGRGLRTVTIGTGITNIDTWAFDGSTGLTSITINATTPPTLGNSVFTNTNNCPIYVPCESVNAYKTATNWSNYADRIQCIQPLFDGKWLATYSNSSTASATCDSTSAITSGEITATNLVSLQIGDCVNSIGNNALMNYDSLTSIDIPNSVVSIGSYAFYGCDGLTNCTIGSGVTSIGTEAFEYCVSLTSIEIPNSVQTIGVEAFMRCGGMTSCTIGSGVTSINNFAFIYCESLSSITINATTPPTLGRAAFDSTNNCPIYVPSQSVDAYKAASGWSDYASRIQAIP